MYQKNLKYLKVKIPGLYHMLQISTPLFLLQTEKTPTGNIRVAHNASNCLLHSEYSIEQELGWMLKNVASNTEIIVIFGFGAGSCIKAIIDKFQNIRHIIIVEPALQILKAILSEQDLAKLLAPASRVDVTFLVNQTEEQMARVVRAVIQFEGRVEFVAHLAYLSLFSEYYQQFHTAMVGFIRQASIRLRTLTLWQQIFLGNTLQNLAVPTYSCEILQSIFQDRPVVIVSAGPSLEKNMHLLSEAQDKTIIIAVGTAIQILNRAGIRPHFYAACDAQDSENEIFQDLNYRDVPLLFANQLNATVVAKYSGPLVRIIIDTDFFGQYIYGIASKPVVMVESGPSVANVVLSLLSKMTCSRVIFIGQDMCLQNDKLHALGNDVEQYDNSRLLTVKDIFGVVVKTLDNYWVIKDDLELKIAKHPNTVFINATEGGLGLNGAKNELFADVLATMQPLDIVIDSEISRIVEEPEKACQDYSPYLMQGCLKEDLDAIGKNIEKSLALLQANVALQENKSVRNKKKIEKNLMLIQRHTGDLSQIKFYEQVMMPSMGHILSTISNLHNSELTDACWDVRIKASTQIWGGKITEIMQYCKFVQERLIARCSDV